MEPAQQSRKSAAELITSRYSILSASLRKLADFILSGPHEAALMTLEELAKETGISKSTADRLSRSLGLSGHLELRALLQQDLRQALRPVEELTKVVGEDQASSSAPWAQSIKEDVQQLQEIRCLGGAAGFARTAACLIEANRVLWIGFGSSAFLAQYAAFCFSGLRSDCEALTDSGGTESVMRKLVDCRPDDAAILIGFPRYSAPLLDAGSYLHRAQVPVIAITDSEQSPIVPFSKECFLARRKSSWVLTGSATGAVAVIEALVRATAALAGADQIRSRSARVTSLLNEAVVPPRE